MKKQTLFCVWLLALGFCLVCQANVPTFEQKLNTLIHENITEASIGLVIQDPSNGQILYSRHPNKNFYPASNTKLFTAAAALKFFGPTFQYQTSIHSNPAKIKAGVLQDNVYFVFRGDPSLTMEDVSQLIQQLKAKGVNRIQGKIIIDDKSFQDPKYAPGWAWDDLPWYYCAPITSVMLNENRVRLKLNKQETLNQKITIEQADPNLPLLKIKSNVKAVTADEAKNSCQLDANVENNQISLAGCWPMDKTPMYIEVALDNPNALVEKIIKATLQKHHIAYAGKITFGKAPKTPALIVKRSAPLKDILVKVLADSNNIYTESLTKALGLAYLGQSSFQVGVRAIAEILAKDTTIDLSKLNLKDGSGVSRYNLVSPLVISQLLYHMYQNPEFNVFYSALSVSGVKGSLKERMKSDKLNGKVIAKTGSATGASALSGYLKTSSGKMIIFSLLINHSLANYNTLKQFEEKLCEILADETWPGIPANK